MLFAALGLLLPLAAAAATPFTLRGKLDSVSPDGQTLVVTSRTGETAKVHIGDQARVTRVGPASLAQVKLGDFVGVAAAPNASGELHALELHIFPESMRGVGAGTRPFDLAPGSSMTNGAISVRVESADGPKLTVAYNGGSQDIVIDKTTPIVAFARGARADLKPGASVIARGEKGADGTIEASSVLVGLDGLVPPM